MSWGKKPSEIERIASKSERKAYRWLIKQGYKPEEIYYNKTGPVDFRTADGKAYEAKWLYENKILIQRHQLKEKNTIILVMSEDSEDPVLQIPMSELEEGKEYYKNIGIVWLPTDTVNITVKLSPENWEKLRRLAAARSTDPKILATHFIIEAINGETIRE